jgi:hypothetical protein
MASLEQMVRSTGDFHDITQGLLTFTDVELAVVHDHRNRYDSGFHVLYGVKDNKEYAMVLLNSVPHSDTYLMMVKMMNDNSRYEVQRNDRKILKTDDGDKELGDKVHLATIMMKNDRLYRPNQEPGHEQGFLMLGDWQAWHLAEMYDQFAYFDPEAGTIDVVRPERKPHTCRYSEARHSIKKGHVPAGGSEFCVHAEPVNEGMQKFILEPYEIAKDQLAPTRVGNHPRLYLANVAPQRQGSLFGF